MKTRMLWVIVPILALGLFVMWPAITQPPPERPEQSPEAPPNDPLSEPADSSPLPLSPEHQALLDNPKVKDFARRLELEEELQRFFADAAKLSDQERQAQARALQERIDQQEQASEISAPEAVLIRLAMIQVLSPDDATARAEASRVISRYQSEAEARLEDWRTTPKPEYERYKKREKAIVKEVMALDAIPGGLTRDQYLRERLQEARVEAMSPTARDDQSN